MATICQKIDKVFCLARTPLSVGAISSVTEIEACDLMPVLQSMLNFGLLRKDEEGRFYRPIVKAEGF